MHQVVKQILEDLLHGSYNMTNGSFHGAPRYLFDGQNQVHTFCRVLDYTRFRKSVYDWGIKHVAGPWVHTEYVHDSLIQHTLHRVSNVDLSAGVIVPSDDDSVNAGWYSVDSDVEQEVVSVSKLLQIEQVNAIGVRGAGRNVVRLDNGRVLKFVRNTLSHDQIALLLSLSENRIGPAVHRIISVITKPDVSMHVILMDLLPGRNLRDFLASTSWLEESVLAQIVDGMIDMLVRLRLHSLVHANAIVNNWIVMKDGSMQLIDFEAGSSNDQLCMGTHIPEFKVLRTYLSLYKRSYHTVYQFLQYLSTRESSACFEH